MFQRVIKTIFAFVFVTVLISVAIEFYRFPAQLVRSWTVIPVLIGLSFVAWVFLKNPSADHRPHWGLPVLSALGVLIVVPFAFIHEAFGTQDLVSILITAQENEMGQSLSVAMDSFRNEIGKYLAYLIVAIAGFIYFSRLHSRVSKAALALTVGLLVFNPVSVFVLTKIVPNKAQALIMPDQLIGKVEVTGRPEVQKNLVIVYLESLERTYDLIPETVSYYAPLKALAADSVEFTALSQIQGTHYTAGGLVGSQCGVPLMPRGMFDPRRKIRENKNIDFELSEFLPEIECLGDILAGDGYVASYLNGSELSVFAKGAFFGSHGYTRLFGRDMLAQPVEDPRQNVWGMDDAYLFEKAKSELRTLAAGDAPFVMSLLTISTHGPEAYLDVGCQPRAGDMDPILTAARCSGERVADLLAEIEGLGIGDETIVVVLSDHLAMKNSVYDLLEASSEQRAQTAIILGAGPARKIARAGTQMDMFPTILEALGYDLADGRANMGVSLLSEEQTLPERYGVETLEEAVLGNRALQERIWASPSKMVATAQ